MTRALVRVAIVIALLAGSAAILSPAFMYPMFGQPGVPTGNGVLALAVFIDIIGIAWIRHIYADPEPDRRFWRYRRHR